MSISLRTNSPRKVGRPPLFSRILPQGNLAKDLTLCYLFNSAPSNFLVDHSTYRHNSSTIQNLTTNYWLPADEGTALYLFSAAAQRTNCGRIPHLHGASRATIAVWFKRRNAASIATVGQGGFNLDALDNNTIYLSMDGVYGNFGDSDNTADWKLVVFTFDGTQTDNVDKLKGYENGAPRALQFNGSIPSDINDDLFNEFFINYSTEYGVYGDASYKFVAVWNRVLLADEVQQLYTDQNYSWLTQEKMLYKPFNLNRLPDPDTPISPGDEDADFIVDIMRSCNFNLGVTKSINLEVEVL